MIFYNQYYIKKIKGAFDRPLYKVYWASGRVNETHITLSSALRKLNDITKNKRYALNDKSR